jgi:hypothetical protein
MLASQNALSTTNPDGTRLVRRSACCMALIPSMGAPHESETASNLSQSQFWKPIDTRDYRASSARIGKTTRQILNAVDAPGALADGGLSKALRYRCPPFRGPPMRQTDDRAPKVVLAETAPPASATHAAKGAQADRQFLELSSSGEAIGDTRLVPPNPPFRRSLQPRHSSSKPRTSGTKHHLLGQQHYCADQESSADQALRSLPSTRSFLVAI